ncbi:MAG: hypothetical protein GTN78_22530 [Gemmatimonadales bacterium]|nr:hypothetical protein [Gemmatimonadales bacterium]NIR02943.1 hypothetical protein [Gemmatimonadales bacterium]
MGSIEDLKSEIRHLIGEGRAVQEVWNLVGDEIETLPPEKLWALRSWVGKCAEANEAVARWCSAEAQGQELAKMRHARNTLSCLTVLGTDGKFHQAYVLLDGSEELVPSPDLTEARDVFGEDSLIWSWNENRGACRSDDIG